MIDKAGAIPNILTRLKKTAIGSGIDLRTYKRDRSVVVMRTAADRFSVKENGFRQELFDVDTKDLKRLLKTLLKREFPHSNKIRVYDATE